MGHLFVLFLLSLPINIGLSTNLMLRMHFFKEISDNSEEVYMNHSPRLPHEPIKFANHALYSLKQTPHAQYESFY